MLQPRSVSQPASALPALTAISFGAMVRRRLLKLGLVLPSYGPHALRYACATQLLAEGFSLKEIADHLGHVS